MQLADRVLNLKPSATLAVNAFAQELKAAGRDIISLSIGEPDFATPEHICKAAIKAIEQGFTHYTAVGGIPELLDAVAAYFGQCGAQDASAANVAVSNGGKHSLYNLFLSVLNPGDEALIPAPYWVSYPSMAELAGAKPVIVPSGVEQGFKVTPDDLEKYRTHKTRACVINSPSNPSGAVYEAAELDAIVQWAVRHNILLVSDEIYCHLVYDGKDRAASLCPYWHKHPENIVVVNGVAKSFAMTGWRVGYMLAAPDVIKAVVKLQGQSTSNICSIAQKATVAALTGGLACVEKMRVSFEHRRNLAMEIIKTWPDVQCSSPAGAFYLFPDMHALYKKNREDSFSLCKYLLDKAGVAAVPGVAFGDDRCIRISYATDDAVLSRALEKIGAALFG